MLETSHKSFSIRPRFVLYTASDHLKLIPYMAKDRVGEISDMDIVSDLEVAELCSSCHLCGYHLFPG